MNARSLASPFPMFSRRSIGSVRVLLALALCATSPVRSQSPLYFPAPPPWPTSHNALAAPAGGVAMLDLEVVTGVVIEQIGVHLRGGAGSAVGLELWITPDTYADKQTTPAAWTLVTTDSGGVTSAGASVPTDFPLGAPVTLLPGRYGIGIRTLGIGMRYDVALRPALVRTDELWLTGAAVVSDLFAGALEEPRTWNGCIHYVPAPGLYANFSATPAVGDSPLQVQFTDTSHSSDPGGITAWAWDFDDDGVVDSTEQNPLHVYPSGGNYSVSLTVTDAVHGSRTMRRPELIEVDPMADFLATPTFGAAPLTVQFSDASSGRPLAWNWDFDADGFVDSIAPDPRHTYTEPGTYTVTLNVNDGVRPDWLTRSALIRVGAATDNTSSPEILEFQFNEPRGTRVNNTASAAFAPSFATGLDEGWQGDPGRALWQAQDAGYGCYVVDPSASSGDWGVRTGWEVELQGSHTFMFWLRHANAAQPDPFSGVFGLAIGPFPGYVNGCQYEALPNNPPGLRLIAWSSVPQTRTATDPMALTGWNHWAIVIDDEAGTAQWFLNGVADGAQTTFEPRSVYLHSEDFYVAGHAGGTITEDADLDDFRLYGRALTPAQIQTAMRSENPTTGTFGDGCAGPAGVPQIRGSGGAPTLAGNPAFAIEVSGMEPNRPAVVQVGLLQTSHAFLPLALDFVPGFAGCVADVAPDLDVFSLPNATGAGSVPLPVPAWPWLQGTHLYAQAVVLGSSQNALSPALDVNLQ